MTIYGKGPGLVNYPRMERQDLTQAQLGSFKFMPVDHIDELTYETPPSPAALFAAPLSRHHPRSNMSLDLSHTLPNDTFRLVSPTKTNTSVLSNHTSRDSHSISCLQPSQAQLTVLQISHSKAADLTTSFPATGSLSNMQPQTESYGSDHIRYRSTPNICASLTQSSTTNKGPDDEHEFQSRLILALESEKQAHQATEALLLAETQARMAAETEVQRLMAHNHSLQGSINLLKGIVQHNVKKERDEAARSVIENHQSIKTSNSSAPAKVDASVSRSILYDAVKRQRERYETAEKLRTTSDALESIQESRASRDDHDETCDLNMNSAESVTSGKDRQLSSPPCDHFLDSSVVIVSATHIENKHRGTLPRSYSTDLIEFEQSDSEVGSCVQTPDETHTDAPEENNLPISNLDVGECETEPYTPQFSPETGHTSVSVAPDVNTEKGLWNASQPIHVPTEFFKKYSESPVWRHRDVVNSSASSSIDESKHESLPVSPAASPAVSASCKNNKVDTHDIVPLAYEPLMAMPYDASIDWKVTAQTPVFDDETDKINRLGFPNKAGNLQTAFYRHPVRYLPSMGEKDLYRTVMIDFIPIGTTYKEILEHVRGGGLESIQLFGPIGASTNFVTTRIVYKCEPGARALYMHGQRPGIVIRGKRVRVWQILQATYPRPQDLEEAISTHGCTRFLLFDRVPARAWTSIGQKLAQQIKAGFVIDIGQSADGYRMIEFTSVVEATKVLEQFMNDTDFVGASLDFEADTCDLPYPEGSA